MTLTVSVAATQAAPPERAYEMVTPAGSISDVRWYNGGERPSTPSGNTVCFGSSLPLDGSDGAGGTQVEDPYCAHRGSAGWTIEGMARPFGVTFTPSIAFGALLRWTSPDGRRTVFQSDFKEMTPDRPLLASFDMFSEGYLRADGKTTWITRVEPLLFPSFTGHPLAASEDLTHIVYLADGMVYEWTPAGARAVSVTEDGTPASGNVPNYRTGDAIWGHPGTVSRDGTRIFFESEEQLASAENGDGTDVYVRESGATTRIVSPRRGPGTDGSANFAGASDDGSVAYVTSGAQLTADPVEGTALYRYTLDSDQVELVEDGIGQVLAVASDGSSVYFRGTDVVSPTDGLSLYVARSGEGTTRVAQLASSDIASFFSADQDRVGAEGAPLRALRLSADGSVAVFRAESDTPGVVGVYRWSETDGLEVVSATSGGTKVDALLGNTGLHRRPGDRNAGRGMSDDGQSVFFETAAPLVSGDVNDDVDVYEWRDGVNRLVSPGKVEGHVKYLDNSADGSTVFFTTYERITPNGDVDNARDVYAARVGEVFPDLPRDPVGDPPPPKGPSAPPAGPTIGSGQERPGEQATPPLVIERVLGLRKPSSSVLRSLARTGRARVPVTVRGGGRVTVTLTARMNGKARTVAKGSRRVAKRGRVTVRVPVRLSRQARRRLASGRGLRLQISVSAPGAQRKRVAVFVRSASAGAGGTARKQG